MTTPYNTGLAITPEPIDFENVEREHGLLPSTATEEQKARRYKDAQFECFWRLYKNGRLPLRLMRMFDKASGRGDA